MVTSIKQIRGSLQLFRNDQVSSPYADHLESPVTSEKLYKSQYASSGSVGAAVISR